MYLITPFVDDELFDWVVKRGASPARVVKPLFRQLVEGMRVRAHMVVSCLAFSSRHPHSHSTKGWLVVPCCLLAIISSRHPIPNPTKGDSLFHSILAILTHTYPIVPEISTKEELLCRTSVVRDYPWLTRLRRFYRKV